jgi:short-subunit dehydrogenase
VILPCDLTDNGSAAYIMRELKKLALDEKVDVLVNNAGRTLRGPLMTSPLDAISDIIDLNVKNTVILTRLLAPKIAKRGSGGRILFVGSLSSVGPGPSVAVFSATKAFLQSFSMSLRYIYVYI